MAIPQFTSLRTDLLISFPWLPLDPGWNGFETGQDRIPPIPVLLSLSVLEEAGSEGKWEGVAVGVVVGGLSDEGEMACGEPVPASKGVYNRLRAKGKQMGGGWEEERGRGQEEG